MTFGLAANTEEKRHSRAPKARAKKFGAVFLQIVRHRQLFESVPESRDHECVTFAHSQQEEERGIHGRRRREQRKFRRFCSKCNKRPEET